MGEARNRGALGARIEAAIKARDPRVEKLRKDLGIPEKVRFCGYLVKVDDADQFLSTAAGGELRFVASPEGALAFETFDEARGRARKEEGEVVVALFDFGAKLIVANVKDDSGDGDATA